LESVGKIRIELATDKTKAILFFEKNKPEFMEVIIRGRVILSKEMVKYISLYIDRQWKFDDHACLVSIRTDDTIRMLTRIMPNTGDASLSRRRLLATVE